MIVCLPSCNIGRPIYLTDRKETMAILKKDTHTPIHICKLGRPLIMLMFCGTHGHLASTTYNI